MYDRPTIKIKGRKTFPDIEYGIGDCVVVRDLPIGSVVVSGGCVYRLVDAPSPDRDWISGRSLHTGKLTPFRLHETVRTASVIREW